MKNFILFTFVFSLMIGSALAESTDCSAIDSTTANSKEGDSSSTHTASGAAQ